MDLSLHDQHFLSIVTHFEGIKLYGLVCIMVVNATFKNSS